MAFRERIEVVVDFVTTGAQTGLNKIKGDVVAADGAFGKMKAGAKGAFDMVGVYGPEMAMAAGTALVAFGVKAVNEFNDAALAAGKFADATGLTSEEASRLIEVASDLGVEAGALEGAIRRVNGAAASGALEDFGVQIATTKDGAYDANQTFLNTIEAIGGIASAAEREAAARKLMGRSWAELAELTTMSAEELRDALASVSDEQVFDDSEVARARDYRAAMDNLRDAVEQVTLSVGKELTPAITEAAETIDSLREIADLIPDIDLPDWMGDVAGAVEEAINPMEALKGSIRDVDEAINGADLPNIASAFYDLAVEMKGTADTSDDFADSADDAGTSTDEFKGKIQELADTLDEEAKRAADEAAEAVERLDRKYQNLFDTLDAADAVEDIKDGFDDVVKAAGDAYGAAVEGSEDAEGKARDYEQALRDQKRRVYEYGQEVLGLPPEALTDVIALIDQGKFAEAEAALAELAKPRTTTLTVKVNQEGTVVVPGASDFRRMPLGGGGAVMGANALWQQALQAWGAITGGGSAGSSGPTKAEKKAAEFDREFERLRRMYERGDITATDYIAELRKMQRRYDWRRYSDRGMAIWREIQRAKADRKRARQELQDALDAKAEADGNDDWTGSGASKPKMADLSSGSGGAGKKASTGGIHIHLHGLFIGGENEMRRAVRPLVPAISRELDRYEGGKS